jgi:hypothetical protein
MSSHSAEVEAVEIGRRLHEKAHPLPALELLANRVEDLEVLIAIETPGEPEPERFGGIPATDSTMGGRWRLLPRMNGAPAGAPRP